MTHKKRPESTVALTVEKGTIKDISIDGNEYGLLGQNLQNRGANFHPAGIPSELIHLLSDEDTDMSLTQKILKEKKHFHITATGTDVSGAKLEGEISYEKLCQLLTTNEMIQTLKPHHAQIITEVRTLSDQLNRAIGDDRISMEKLMSLTNPWAPKPATPLTILFRATSQNTR